MHSNNINHLLSSAQTSVEKLAFTDHLTGMRNFPKFMLDAQLLLQEFPNKKYAFWSYDIKNFHSINATFGSNAGDRVLKQIALVFEEFEESDHAFCRNLGDQFLGIRSYVEKKDLVDWFCSCVSRLDDRKVFPKKQMPVDSAMGFYCIEDFEEPLTIRDKVNYASVARNVAKAQMGTQFYFFSPELKQKIIRQATLRNDGDSALSCGEIGFVVQPKVAIEADFRIVGGEVLVRWSHPFYGRISPSEFIPMFEENGFIIKLDRYIFNQACAWYSQNLRQGIALSNLAINVSRQSFLQDDFVDYYSSVKQAHNIADNILELEVTENILLENYESFRNVILDIQDKGFKCSIDDLGSGYSSLTALRNLPINILKLDSAFFKDGPDTDRGEVIVTHVINMAQELGIKTVAEGVELPTQVNFLKKAGCNTIQGYVFSKPLPQKEFIELFLKEKSCIEMQDLKN